MSRPVDNGWDFLKVGNTYQYKEDWFIAMVTILEDNSDEDYYRFKLRVEKATENPPQNGEFEVSHYKKFDGVYSGMMQFYENVEYYCRYTWKREGYVDKEKAMEEESVIVRIEKIEERHDATHPNNISTGFVKEGKFEGNPVVGGYFFLDCGDYRWGTSKIVEIIDENTFKTLNSVYKWTILKKEN